MSGLTKENPGEGIGDIGCGPSQSGKGFTLVELMLAVALSSLVLSSVASVYIKQRRNATAQEQVSELQQNLRAALYVMEHEIRLAGFDPSKTGGAGIATAMANNLVFTHVADTDNTDNDGDGNVDETNELKTSGFRIYDSLGDGDTELGLQRGTGFIQAVVENIDAIEFLYTLDDGTQALKPSDPSDIRAVTISILARAGRADPEYFNTTIYTPASGNASPPLTLPGSWDINHKRSGTGNPARDNFRRRLISFTVQCRNMGL